MASRVRRVAILGGNRTPFARSPGPYSAASNQDLLTATLDGLVKETGAVFEAKFMLPWSFSEEAAAEKNTAQLQHNMLVANTNKSVLSIITGGGKHEVTVAVEVAPIS